MVIDVRHMLELVTELTGLKVFSILAIRNIAILTSMSLDGKSGRVKVVTSVRRWQGG